MILSVDTLKSHERRLHRARRVAKHADRAVSIGREHERAMGRVPLILADPGSLDRYFADTGHRRFKADRAFGLARTLYARAERIRQGKE